MASKAIINYAIARGISLNAVGDTLKIELTENIYVEYFKCRGAGHCFKSASNSFKAEVKEELPGWIQNDKQLKAVVNFLSSCN